MATMDFTRVQWRVGTSVRRTIYAVLPGKEHDQHPLIGVMDTPQLAVETVSAHNKTMNTQSFAEKSQLIEDLQLTWEFWKENNDLEESIILATDGAERTRKVYEAVGAWVDILGTDSDMPRVFQQAINQIKES